MILVVCVTQKNTTLEVLSLYDNQIGIEGGKAIAKALEVNPFFLSFVLCGYPPPVTQVISVILVL